MTEIKQYSERDAMELDEVGGYYFRHVLAMTAEGLHSKSEIAAELGWRDMQIAALQEQVLKLSAENSIQDFIISAVKDLVSESEGVAGWHLNGDIASWDKVLPEINHSETPATDAALREIRAQEMDSLSGVAETMLVKFANQNASKIPEALAWSMVKRHAEDRAARIRTGDKQ